MAETFLREAESKPQHSTEDLKNMMDLNRDLDSYLNLDSNEDFVQ